MPHIKPSQFYKYELHKRCWLSFSKELHAHLLKSPRKIRILFRNFIWLLQMKSSILIKLCTAQSFKIDLNYGSYQFKNFSWWNKMTMKNIFLKRVHCQFPTTSCSLDCYKSYPQRQRNHLLAEGSWRHTVRLAVIIHKSQWIALNNVSNND